MTTRHIAEGAVLRAKISLFSRSAPNIAAGSTGRVVKIANYTGRKVVVDFSGVIGVVTFSKRDVTNPEVFDLLN